MDRKLVGPESCLQPLAHVSYQYYQILYKVPFLSSKGHASFKVNAHSKELFGNLGK